MQLPGPPLSPTSKNWKKSALKKILILQDIKHFCPTNKFNKTVLKTSGPKKLTKTSLRETGCLSNLYYLLSCQASNFLIHHPLLNTVSQATFGTLKKYIFKKSFQKEVHFQNCSLRKHIFKIVFSKNFITIMGIIRRTF